MTLLVACKSCRRQYDVGFMKPGEQVRCSCGKAIVVPTEQPHVARILHCASCGGDLGERAKKCGYCGCEVTAAARNMGPACPICFARLPGEARFCSECGVGIKPELIRTTPVDVACPRCEGKLVLRELDDMLLTDCTTCGGLWLDAQAFENLVKEKDTRRLSSAAISSVTRPHVALDDGKYLACLVCKKLMQRKNFAGCSGVIIDWCRNHGVWFDAKELESIVQFIEQGGLAKAKKVAPARPVTRPITGGVTGRPAPTYGGGAPTNDDWSWATFIAWTIADIFL